MKGVSKVNAERGWGKQIFLKIEKAEVPLGRGIAKFTEKSNSILSGIQVQCFPFQEIKKSSKIPKSRKIRWFDNSEKRGTVLPSERGR